MKAIVFGVGGLIVGLVFSLVYGVIALLTGGMPTPQGSVISPLSATAMYLVTCGAGGLIVGVLHSLLGSTAGSALLGSIGMAPVMVGSAVLYEGSLGSVDWRFAVVGSILVGVPIGIAIRQEFFSFQKEE